MRILTIFILLIIANINLMSQDIQNFVNSNLNKNENEYIYFIDSENLFDKYFGSYYLISQDLRNGSQDPVLISFIIYQENKNDFRISNNYSFKNINLLATNEMLEILVKYYNYDILSIDFIKSFIFHWLNLVVIGDINTHSDKNMKIYNFDIDVIRSHYYKNYKTGTAEIIFVENKIQQIEVAIDRKFYINIYKAILK